MTQQKQRKQLILTDNKNISTYRFQSVQRLQPNFMTDGIRNFMYAKHKGDNAKLRIFSFIPQRQRIQPNFMNHTYQTTKHTNTTQNDQNNHINVCFTTNTKFKLLQLKCKFWSTDIQTS